MTDGGWRKVCNDDIADLSHELIENHKFIPFEIIPSPQLFILLPSSPFLPYPSSSFTFKITHQGIAIDLEPDHIHRLYSPFQLILPNEKRQNMAGPNPGRSLLLDLPNEVRKPFPNQNLVASSLRESMMPKTAPSIHCGYSSD